MSFYPNPFSNNTKIVFNEELKEADLILYNSYGEIATKIGNLSCKSITLSREKLSKGPYFIQIVQNDKVLFTDSIFVID